MAEMQNKANYHIGGTNYTVIRNFTPTSQLDELIRRELARLNTVNYLTKPQKDGIMKPYIAGSH